jgi:hypothetical protein
MPYFALFRLNLATAEMKAGVILSAAKDLRFRSGERMQILPLRSAQGQNDRLSRGRSERYSQFLGDRWKAGLLGDRKELNPWAFYLVFWADFPLGCWARR